MDKSLPSLKTLQLSNYFISKPTDPKAYRILNSKSSLFSSTASVSSESSFNYMTVILSSVILLRKFDLDDRRPKNGV